MKILYATDLDRTIIFSGRFMTEFQTTAEYDIAEKRDWEKDEGVISYISIELRNKLIELNNNPNVEIVPVTTRSLEEYNRINLGFKPKYAIIDCGGTILKNGEPMGEWENFVKSQIDAMEMLDIALDMQELKSKHSDRNIKCIDNKFLFTKVTDPELFDKECEAFVLRYPKFNFFRQRNKVYVIPTAFSKVVSVRWLQNKLEVNKLVACGDSELDLPMLAIADFAVVPGHGSLVTEKYVTDGRITKAGINASLDAVKIVNSLLRIVEV